MTVFEGLMGQEIKVTPRGRRHLPEHQALSFSEMISSGAYSVVQGVERLIARR